MIGSDVVNFLTSGARGWCGSIEEIGIECGEFVAFRADHFVEPTVKLDSARPFAILVFLQRHGCFQWLESCVEAVHVLSVQAEEAVFTGNSCEHMMESSGLGVSS